MQAWQVTRPGAPGDVLRRVEIERPDPGPGEVRLAVRAVALGLPDALLCRGAYAFSPPLPFVPGQEVCGTVDAVGPGVDLVPGTRVMAVTNFFDGRGGLAEYAVARAESAFRVPEAMSDVEAAGFRIGFSTAWIGLVHRAAARAGERLLVLGAAGGSGAAAIAVGLALGLEVLAVVSGAEKAAFARGLGATVVIDRTTGTVVDAVLAATGGDGVDLVYDPVGGDLADATVDCLARDGRLLAVGFASGRWARPDPWTMVRRNVALVGVYAGGYSRAENEADHERLLALAADGRLTTGATVVDFADAADAVTALADGRAVGKQVVRLA